MEDLDFQNLTSNRTLPKLSPISTPLYLYIWITIANAIIFCTGLFGNVLVLAVVGTMRDMRTPTNYCLVNLGVADLFVLLVCQTSALLEFYAEDRWLLGETLCRLIPFLESFVTHASILIMIGISCGRYYAVCRPLQSYSKCGKMRSLTMTTFLWFLAAISAVPFLLLSHTETAVHYNGSDVTVCRTHMTELWTRIYLVAIFCIFFAFPMIILLYIYTKIVRKIIVESLQMENKHTYRNFRNRSIRGRRQSVFLLLGIVILFFICVLPMRIVTFWIVFSKGESIANLGFEGFTNVLWLARVLLYANSAGNSIIYSIFSEKFRIAFMKILKIRKENPVTNRETFISLRSCSAKNVYKEDMV